jgi:hypothetical protein
MDRMGDSNDLDHEPHGCRRRRWMAGLALGLACLGLGGLGGLGGCSTIGVPSTLRFSETDLTLMLSRQFPQERRVLEVIDVQLANPQLMLLPESNRLSTAFDVTADDRLFGGHAAAHVKLDYALRYEPKDRTLRLQDVRVEELTLAPGAAPMRGQAQRLGVLAAEHVLENLAIYKMRPDQADRMDQFGVEPKSIKVTSQGVEVAVGPKAPT